MGSFQQHRYFEFFVSLGTLEAIAYEPRLRFTCFWRAKSIAVFLNNTRVAPATTDSVDRESGAFALQAAPESRRADCS